MARSLSRVSSLAASLADGLSPSLLPAFRRGYVAVSEAAVPASLGRGRSTAGVVGKLGRMGGTKQEAGATSAWGPDPVTGYYRPENGAVEIDPAELREMLLSRRVRPH